MKKYSIQFIVLAFFASLFTTIPANAKSTGWISLSETRSFYRKNRKKMTVTSITCKSGPGIEPRKGAMLMKIGYKPGRIAGINAWSFNHGTIGQMRIIDTKMRKKGYKRKSWKTFRRPTGIALGCGLWIR